MRLNLDTRVCRLESPAVALSLDVFKVYRSRLTIDEKREELARLKHSQPCEPITWDKLIIDTNKLHVRRDIWRHAVVEALQGRRPRNNER